MSYLVALAPHGTSLIPRRSDAAGISSDDRISLGRNDALCESTFFGYPIHYVFLVATARVRNPHCNLHYLATIVTFKILPKSSPKSYTNPATNPTATPTQIHYKSYQKSYHKSYHISTNSKVSKSQNSRIIKFDFRIFTNLNNIKIKISKSTKFNF